MKGLEDIGVMVTEPLSRGPPQLPADRGSSGKKGKAVHLTVAASVVQL